MKVSRSATADLAGLKDQTRRLSLPFVDNCLPSSATGVGRIFPSIQEYSIRDDNGRCDRKRDRANRCDIGRKRLSPTSRFSATSARSNTNGARWSSAELATPYQRFDFVNAWQDHVGVRLGAKPLAAVAYDSEKRPVMVLPLVARSLGPFRTACFPGGKHSNFNMALWRREFAAAATRADTDAIIAMIGRREPSLDVLALASAAAGLERHAEPVRAAVAPAVGQRVSTADDRSRSSRPGRTRAARSAASSTARNESCRPCPAIATSSPATRLTRTRLLDAFFAVKPLRMAEQKIRNVFAEPGTERSSASACIDGIAAGKAGDRAARPRMRRRGDRDLRRRW